MTRTDLLFSYNWNNKLWCDVFTTIRIKQPINYFEGAEKRILLKDNKAGTITHGETKYLDLGTAEILSVTDLQMGKINNGIALVDTAYNAVELRQILSKMYPEYIAKHGNEAMFSFIILKYKFRTFKPHDMLFQYERMVQELISINEKVNNLITANHE